LDSPAPPVADQFSAKFVAHLTYTDQGPVAPGSRLVKAWRMRNEGRSAWPEGTRLAFVGGELLGAPEAGVPVPAVAPGATVDIAVPFVAPSAPGRYQSYWRLATADGQRFGHRLWADVFVDGPAPLSAVPSVGGTPVPAPNMAATSAVLAALAAVDGLTPAPSAPAGGLSAAPSEGSTASGTAGGSRWAIHHETLAGMGFTDVVRNEALLNQYSGNLLRVVNALMDTARASGGAAAAE
jgi:hypothetical protein